MGDPVLKKAKKRVAAKKGFYVHFVTYLSVGIFFFLLNMILITQGESELWFFFPLLPWLVGLLIHYFVVFGIPGTKILTEDWEEEELAKEMIRMRRQLPFSEPAPYPEDAPEESLDLEEPRKQKEKQWDSGDIV